MNEAREAQRKAEADMQKYKGELRLSGNQMTLSPSQSMVMTNTFPKPDGV